MHLTFLRLFLVTTLWNSIAIGQSCDPVDFDNGSIVCKCNATYCDFYPDPEPPSTGKYIWYATSKAGKRLERNDGNISSAVGKHSITVKINSTNKYQTIEGFGGAFSDSAGINIKNLSLSTQDNMMRSYFTSNGSKYNIGRVPIAATDFSTRSYSYDDSAGDKTLKKFSLAMEDTEYKIPLMKQALQLNPQLRFLSAAWTAPNWMKNENSSTHIRTLKDEYYQVFADYIVKFLEEYKNNGLKMWAVTTGNEPLILVEYALGDNPNTLHWSPENVAKWIVNNLGPSLQNSNSKDTCLLVYEDQRPFMLSYMTKMQNTSRKSIDYIKGMGLHPYNDERTPASVLDDVHDAFPDKFILMTEHSLNTDAQNNKTVSLGSWIRAETLIKRMFENFNHWVVGWVDWNLAVNATGGPNWSRIFTDSAMIVDAENDLFYKQPYYYAMTHFSKFVPRNSVRIQAKSSNGDILTLAFKTEDDQNVVVLYNTNGAAKNVSVVNGSGYINIELPEYSLNTILFKN